MVNAHLSLENVIQGSCSFTGDTPVLMADGTHKPIKDIRIGDQVLAADPETGESGPAPSPATWAHQDTVLDLHLEGGVTVTTTEDHPFWNATAKQWQRADALRPGDQLHTANGTHISVIGLRPTSTRTTTAHNLTVADIHTYYVLASTKPVLPITTACRRCSTKHPRHTSGRDTCLGVRK
jgi:hypothetical protein